MVNVKVSRTISGDPERIWNLINQVERFPEWMPDVVDAKVTAKDRDNGIGRRQVLRTNMSVGRGEVEQEVIAWDPPHKITWQHIRDVINGKELSHAKEIRTTLSITNSNGEITFRMVGSWEPAGISGQLMTRMMKRIVARNFEQALKNLEKLAQEEEQSDIAIA